jgi:hypothetical protein
LPVECKNLSKIRLTNEIDVKSILTAAKSAGMTSEHSYTTVELIPFLKV